MSTPPAGSSPTSAGLSHSPSNVQGDDAGADAVQELARLARRRDPRQARQWVERSRAQLEGLGRQG